MKHGFVFGKGIAQGCIYEGHWLNVVTALYGFCLSESGNLHFQVGLTAELEGMCPVSYADPLLLIERCIVIYTGLVVFQGSLQGETAVPPASCLERENGRERKRPECNPSSASCR